MLRLTLRCPLWLSILGEPIMKERGSAKFCRMNGGILLSYYERIRLREQV